MKNLGVSEPVFAGRCPDLHMSSLS
jgi:hypothetical protein